jgi:hypothetical protein
MEKTKGLKKWYCPECGGEVWFTYERPSATFAIENGEIVRMDNNDVFQSQGLFFHCCNDAEHKIEPHYKSRLWKIFSKWCTAVENNFYGNSNNGEL